MYLRTRCVTALTLLTLAALLLSGLTPRDFRVPNDAGWDADRATLRFDGRGIAYTDHVPVPAADEFSVDLVFLPGDAQAQGYSFILAFHSGDDDTQFVIGQWRSFVIIMNGDDYEYRRRLPRVTVNLAEVPAVPVVLTVSSGGAGTQLYANGLLVDEVSGVRLRIPGVMPGAEPETTPGFTARARVAETRLILGNSPLIRNGWTGTIFGVEIRDEDTSPETAVEIAERRRARAVGPAPESMWHASREIRWDGVGSPAVHVPRYLRVLQRSYLRFRGGSGGSRYAMAYDVLINIVGFLPFGALLCVLVFRRHNDGGQAAAPGGATRAVLIAVFTGFAVSLVIELTQAWLPGRHSSLIDLALNTAGTALGALFALRWTKRLTVP